MLISELTHFFYFGGHLGLAVSQLELMSHYFFFIKRCFECVIGNICFFYFLFHFKSHYLSLNGGKNEF